MKMRDASEAFATPSIEVMKALMTNYDPTIVPLIGASLGTCDLKREFIQLAFKFQSKDYPEFKHGSHSPKIEIDRDEQIVMQRFCRDFKAQIGEEFTGAGNLFTPLDSDDSILEQAFQALQQRSQG